MSMTADPNRMSTAAGGPTLSSTMPEARRARVGAHRVMRETKPSFMTTEFWAMLAGIAALIVLYNVTDNPDLTLWRTCLLATVIAAAYIVSRGWAKSGSHDDYSDWE